jgi:hypothetical protein
LVEIDPTRSDQLYSEIQVFRKKRSKENAKLAKDIARWVDNVLVTTSNRPAVTQSSASASAFVDDLDISGDEDDNDSMNMR